VVKEYLLEHPERVEEESLRQIASDLGVSEGTVRNARDALQANGKLRNLTQFTTSEKRDLVRSYHDNNPDASNREVAREVDCDVTHVTVGNWRSEWREDAEDGLTQAEMAEKLGKDWSRSKVADHTSLLNNVVAEVLEIAKSHQEGRATGDVASETFTEFWFRKSGLYDPSKKSISEDIRQAHDFIKVDNVWRYLLESFEFQFRYRA